MPFKTFLQTFFHTLVFPFFFVAQTQFYGAPKPERSDGIGLLSLWAKVCGPVAAQVEGVLLPLGLRLI